MRSTGIVIFVYRYTVDTNSRLVVVTFGGTLRDSDPLNYLTDMLDQTEYGPGWRTMVDLTQISDLELSLEGVQELIDFSRRVENRLRGARVAILAPAYSAILGMARLYETLNDRAPYAIGVFTDNSAAKIWLTAV